MATGVFQVASQLKDSADVTEFRDTATERISRMHDLKRLLEAYGQPVTVIREDRIGFVIFEDDLQVVAEPFADTVTGA